MTCLIYQLTDHFTVHTSLENCWAFFSDAANLPKITPPAMKFTIVTPSPIVIQADSILDYKVHVMLGIPVKWKTSIIDWSPMRQFIDLQLKGPYTLWHHQHTFKEVEGGVECRDRVTYKMPFGPIGRLTHALMVKRQLLEVFRFRRTAIEKLVGRITPLQEDVQIRVVG